ncbi:tRNA lysidine(34) synthetase [Desulfomarina sp.]
MDRNFCLPSHVNRKIGRAMHDYSMLDDGDRVMVAVSGGIDSLTLAWILKSWRKKAPISYEVTVQIIDHGFWRDHPDAIDPEKSIGKQLEKLAIAYTIDPAWGRTDQLKSCFQCARNRRSQLFDLARQRGFNKIALGHHMDDLIETFFLNILYSGNISTMVPVQKLFGGKLELIRPMAYLEKSEVKMIGGELGFLPVENFCPFSDRSRRESVRKLLTSLYDKNPLAKKSLFAALANVRSEYML